MDALQNQSRVSHLSGETKAAVGDIQEEVFPLLRNSGATSNQSSIVAGECMKESFFARVKVSIEETNLI